METLKEASHEIMTEVKASLKSPKTIYPEGIKAIYDNGGETFDRYTVYYSNRKDWGIVESNKWPYVGMSEHPFHPQGFGQHGAGRLGRHNGKRIRFEDLPDDCQKLVKQDLEVN